MGNNCSFNEQDRSTSVRCEITCIVFILLQILILNLKQYIILWAVNNNQLLSSPLPHKPKCLFH